MMFNKGLNEGQTLTLWSVTMGTAVSVHELRQGIQTALQHLHHVSLQWVKVVLALHLAEN